MRRRMPEPEEGGTRQEKQKKNSPTRAYTPSQHQKKKRRGSLKIQIERGQIGHIRRASDPPAQWKHGVPNMHVRTTRRGRG
jgi:hypothetical protein